jgi:cytosine deaminase
MLVLTRQRNQSVMIGSDVEMTIVDIKGDKVRLGFVAPQTVQIHRREVFDQIAQENRAASGLSPADLAPALSVAQRPAKADGSYHMDPFLRAAIDEAKVGLSEGGLPIGSVLVRGDEIIGRGHNRRVQHGDPMAHAEIDCLTRAGRQKTYKDTVLYSTLMPCFLCTGAVVQFGIPKVIVGESVTFPGGAGKWGRSPDFMRANGVEVVNLNDTECIEMMTRFIRERPGLWNEDIGKE